VSEQPSAGIAVGPAVLGRRTLWIGGVVIFVVAFLARLVPLLRGGGLTGLNHYDDGVNFGGAVGLVHGELPYRDFLWLHPPGIQLALAPFAALSYLVGEPVAFVLGRLAWIVLGSLTAVLIARFLLPAGWLGAVFGGLLYATFWPALVSTQTVRLEGLTSFMLIIALLLLTPDARRPAVTTRAIVVAGMLLGAATTVKIWGLVAVLVLAGWLWARDGFRRAVQLVGGAALACFVICLPFFVAAPSAMWRMIVLDQLDRPRADDIGHRLAHLTGVSPISATWGPALGLVLAALIVAAVLAWTLPRARPAVLLLVAFIALLMATPTWFFHYGGLTAPVIALVAGAGVQQLIDLPALRDRAAVRKVISLAALAALALPLAFAAMLTEGERFPASEFQAALKDGTGCVTSDHPTALILTDRIGTNLARGCRLVIDLGGYSHDLAAGQDLSRRGNRAFQAFALDYLRTGDRAILARFTGDVGWSRASYRQIERWPVLAESGELSVRVPE
jgi:alpha-1,2-mannosyltransferase